MSAASLRPTRAYLKLLPSPSSCCEEEEEPSTSFQGFYRLVAEHQKAVASNDVTTAKAVARELAFQAGEVYLMTMRMSEVISSAAL